MVWFVGGCDFKKVDKEAAKKNTTMKCAPGKCGASMYKDDAVQNQDAKPVMKCAPGKCGGSNMKCAAGKCGKAN